MNRHLTYGTCFSCGRWYSIRKDGTLRKHDGKAGAWTCPGSRKPPRSDQ